MLYIYIYIYIYIYGNWASVISDTLSSYNIYGNWASIMSDTLSSYNIYGNWASIMSDTLSSCPFQHEDWFIFTCGYMFVVVLLLLLK